METKASGLLGFKALESWWFVRQDEIATELRSLQDKLDRKVKLMI